MSIKLVIKRYGDPPHTKPLDEKTFAGPIITIGSDQAATLRLSDAAVAPEHAIIISEGNQLLLINRAEGTVLNRERLMREARSPIADGDTIRIGMHVINFVLREAHNKEEPQKETRPLSADPLVEAPSATPRVNHPNPDTPSRSFADILASLRTEEDSFYFLIEGGAQSGQRVIIESAVMLLGWNEAEQNISTDVTTMVTPLAVVRKDWNGVVLQPLGPKMITVNDKPIESVHHLHDGDRLILASKSATTERAKPFLVFHEPASLMALEEIIPQKIPPPVSLQTPTQTPSDHIIDLLVATKVGQVTAKIFKPQRRYFGYFTILEILVMVVGTLIAAVIFFLLLVYFKS